ncbi:MAG: hypothetical protein HZB50_17750 [Chloroflexi bacterium]|nr:hypothetical protein [Chloroflexota bacterium]
MKIKPIEIVIHGHSQQSSEEMCSTFLDTERWSDFKGYSILPGIKSARFEIRTPALVGSRIKVENTDGSSHVEEIIEWDETSKIKLRFQEFDSPLKYLATHFIETWSFHRSDEGTETIRSMAMYPKGVAGWLMLMPISQLMKKAFKKNASQLGSE